MNKPNPCCANCEHYKNDIDDVVDSYRCEKWGLIGANTKPEDFCSRFEERKTKRMTTGKYLIEVDESEIVECWNEQAAKELDYQEYALKQYPGIKVKPYNPSGDLISRKQVLDELMAHQYSQDFCKEHNIEYSINSSMVRIIVNDAQTVEPGRSNGKWVGIADFLKHLEELTGNRYSASQYYDGSLYCNHCWAEGGTTKTNFCPNCGADMRKGDIDG